MFRILIHRLSVIVLALTALAAFVSLPALSQTRKSKPVGVVELFTSQGCSNCPKADRAIETLAGRDDVVTIAYHVDYWNYLGWQDTLSAKENTARQYGYAKTLGISNVFTPQIILNGGMDTKLMDPAGIMAELGELGQDRRGIPVDISAELNSDELAIHVGEGSGKADVVIAYFNKKTEVEIQKGENEGKKIAYRNAVTKLETVGMWDGKAMTVKLPAALLAKRGFDGCAILLQAHDGNGNPSRILGAVAL
jgi:hypothetical protein